ncbi:hypothetical protein RchiOBHm_Chr1g0326881 [Rosa chinensis]|uniref:Uncharacterized protein n=1 Tax=Rosa chinensis TaxID=74649 RepID=A0A2P6SAF6_ROSCH|nr:hypothetical protein RchiOBHm_Chr1g0326881 [Rosa chinensis]
MDVWADKLINGVAGIDPQRRAELIKVLDIDLSWRCFCLMRSRWTLMC